MWEEGWLVDGRSELRILVAMCSWFKLPYRQKKHCRPPYAARALCDDP
jgi:hypothetical protein